VHKETQVLKVLQEPKVHKDLLVQLLEPLVRKETKVLRGTLERQTEHLVLQVLKGLRGLQVF
jgi:hypothetical protein